MSDILELFLTIARSIRTRFREKGKEYRKSNELFVKIYNSDNKAVREYETISSMGKESATLFRVPKILKVTMNPTQKRAIVVMERVNGRPLESFALKFLLFGDHTGIITFRQLGKALRELHRTGAHSRKTTYMHRIPDSETDLLNGIKKFDENLKPSRLIRPQLFRFLEAQGKFDNGLMQEVNLYGEAYLSHILVSDNKFIFLDLEESRYGPLYYDLATFAISIYTSLLIPSKALPKLRTLRNSFLLGYFGKKIPFESIKIAELYLLLREMDILCNHPMHSTEAFRRRVSRALKLRRCRWLVNTFLLSEF